MYCQVVIFYDVLKRLGEGFYTIQDFFDWILRRNGLTESEINKILKKRREEARKAQDSKDALATSQPQNEEKK